MHHTDPAYVVDYASEYDTRRENLDFEYDVAVPAIEVNLDHGDNPFLPELHITVGIDNAPGVRDQSINIGRESLFLQRPRLNNWRRASVY